MTEFSHETLALLKSVGWDENYRCEVTGFVNPYEFECPPASDIVMDFMQRYGGLKINPSDRSDKSLPIEFLKHPICDDFSHFAERLGLEVKNRLVAYVIGNAYGGHIELFMTNNGYVYGHYDAPLWKFGNSGIEAIENLCHDRWLTEYK